MATKKSSSRWPFLPPCRAADSGYQMLLFAHSENTLSVQGARAWGTLRHGVGARGTREGCARGLGLLLIMDTRVASSRLLRRSEPPSLICDLGESTALSRVRVIPVSLLSVTSSHPSDGHHRLALEQVWFPEAPAGAGGRSSSGGAGLPAEVQIGLSGGKVGHGETAGRQFCKKRSTLWGAVS